MGISGDHCQPTPAATLAAKAPATTEQEKQQEEQQQQQQQQQQRPKPTFSRKSSSRGVGTHGTCTSEPNEMRPISFGRSYAWDLDRVGFKVGELVIGSEMALLL